MTSLVIGVPTSRGHIESEYFQSLLQTVKRLSEIGVQGRVMSLESALISHARNVIAHACSRDYLMFIDSDMQFPYWGIEKLLSHEKDIIGGLYYRKKGDYHPLSFMLNEEGRFQEMLATPKKLFECDGIATGFLLISKKVLDAFTPKVEAEIGQIFSLYTRPEDGGEEGEDLAFCRRAKKLGFKIWCDPEIPLGHVGKKIYGKDDFYERMQFHAWNNLNLKYNNKITGWSSKAEMNWLYEQAEKMETIVEVGSWKGKSTHALLSACKGTVWAIDHWKGSVGWESGQSEAKYSDVHKVFLENVGHFKNLKVLKMPSLEGAKQFKDKSVDMVFIDGGHDYKEVKADIEAWLPKTKKLLCGHDYNFDSVKHAVIQKFGELDTADSIWIKEIK